ncbi:DUF1707 domain-containing protein [Streptomyces cocklensis]|uniref:DUF1707 domain-containing protein n=1 Tax=Actinacidiphila cocklensis TaxID=887465 RepID=A0A9W4GT57_9ACTN|nr:DUF1707 domain-containing protein [Actinacidiphila cocklensis]MDD1063423.1 DUF1707 domain-containing protein [Actinacidiphila cocklensis]CAG6395961.1 conserved hypothetical protein [Actinacidiphila cocklensis]
MTQEPARRVGQEQLEQRVSHDDRERVAEVLRVAAGDGRLSLEELEERLESCFAARTYGDLAPLVADLPGQAVVVGEPVRAKEVARVRRAGGNVRYEGGWEVPRRMEFEVLGGNVLLDFTSAAVREPATEVEVDMRGGNLRLVVPDGYVVDAEEVDMRGGSVLYRHAKDRDPHAPAVHRITVTGSMVGGNIVIQPPRPPRRPGRLRRLLGRA